MIASVTIPELKYVCISKPKKIELRIFLLSRVYIDLTNYTSTLVYCLKYIMACK